MGERLEIDGLRALCAIADHGGVTRAAGFLALSQSAVSHKIRRLEQGLDCTLLARRPGGPLFTEAGEELLGYARRMMDLHDEALAELSKKPLAGMIRLGMTEDTTTSEITAILGRFTRLYPEVHVSTRTSQSLNVQAWMAAGDLDVAVVQVFASDVRPDDTVLFQDILHWVASPDLKLDPEALVPFLAFDENCFYGQWALREGSDCGHTLRKVLECPSAAGIQSAVRAGLGVAVLNGMHVTSEMRVIEGVFPEPPAITYIARVRKAAQSAVASALVTEIARSFPTAPSLRTVTVRTA